MFRECGVPSTRLKAGVSQVTRSTGLSRSTVRTRAGSARDLRAVTTTTSAVTSFWILDTARRETFRGLAGPLVESVEVLLFTTIYVLYGNH